MSLWRVFGLADKYDDQPQPYWSDEGLGPRADSDRLTVMIGGLPDDLLTTLRQWRAQASGILNLFVGHSMTYEELLASYQSNLQSVLISEFDPYTAWMTLRLDRSLQAEAGATEINWLTNAEYVFQQMGSFGDEGSRFLDMVTARVFGSAPKLQVRRLRFADQRPYLTVEGKAAVSIPRLEGKVKDSGVIIGRGGGWASAPTGQVSSAIKQVPATKVDYKLIGQPTSWLCAAMAEEDDHLRRFTFAFAGLELLATQTEKANRDALITRMERLDSTLPVREFFWPSTNEDFAVRNVVFRFAALATLYSPGTAVEDVKKFKVIAKGRNDFYHGSEQIITLTLARDCEELLRKYVGLVASGTRA